MSKLTSFFWLKILKIGKFFLFQDKKLYYFNHYGTLNFFRLNNLKDMSLIVVALFQLDLKEYEYSDFYESSNLFRMV